MGLLDRFRSKSTSSPQEASPVTSLIAPSPSALVLPIPEPKQPAPAPDMGELARMVTSLVLAQNKPQIAAAQVKAYLTNELTKWQTPLDPRFRPYTPLSADTLRVLARTYDVLAACVTHLKSEVVKVPLVVVARDGETSTKAEKDAIVAAQSFLGPLGGLGGHGVRRAAFEGQLLDDLLILGCYAVHYEFDTRGDWVKGRPCQCRALDAATIRPLVSSTGFPRGDEETAYEQWIDGRVVGQFSRREMSYEGLPTLSRTDSPYSMSLVEMAAMVVFTAMKSDEWNRAWLTSGNGRGKYVKFNDTVTPDQAAMWLEIIDLQTSNNASERQKIGGIPGDLVGGDSRKDSDFQAFEHWLATRVMSVMGVNPASIGFNGGQYEANQDAAMGATREGTVAQLLEWRSAFYDDLLERLGFPFLQVAEDVPAKAEEPGAKATRQQTEIGGGIKTINEVRAENGLPAVDGGDTLLFASTLVPMERLLAPPPEAAPAGDPASDGPGDKAPNDKESAERAAAGELGRSLESGDVPVRENLEVAKAEPKHKYSCVMAVLDKNAANLVRQFGSKLIDKADLADDGRESTPHITVRYGVHTNDANEVAGVLGKWGHIAAKVTGVSVFEAGETGGDYDVVKLDVQGNDGSLSDAHQALGELEHTDTHPEYKPHITLAYVKAGAGKKYAGAAFPYWNGGPKPEDWLLFDTVHFSDRDGNANSIDLHSGHVSAVERALAQWERKVLNRLSRGQGAACAFESEILDRDTKLDILTRLHDVENKDEVREVFRAKQGDIQ